MIRACCVALSLLSALSACSQGQPAPPKASVVARTPAAAPLALELDAAPTLVDVPLLPEPASLLEREAVALADGDLVDHKAFALSLLQQGQPAQARDELKQALTTDSSAETWALLGDAYLRTGDVDRGIPCLLEAVSLDVDQLSARQLLTRHFLSTNDAVGARAHAEEWVRLQPQDPSSRQALGRALSQAGMWKEAIGQFALVVELQPDNAYAFNNLGFAALQLGDNQRAVHSLERVLTLKPQQGYMLNNLGVGYERLGRAAEAHAAFARAAELSPRYAQASVNRDRIQRGMSKAQHVVAADTLLKLRNGVFEDMATVGPFESLDLPPMPSADGE